MDTYEDEERPNQPSKTIKKQLFQHLAYHKKLHIPRNKFFITYSQSTKKIPYEGFNPASNPKETGGVINDPHGHPQTLPAVIFASFCKVVPE